MSVVRCSKLISSDDISGKKELPVKHNLSKFFILLGGLTLLIVACNVEPLESPHPLPTLTFESSQRQRDPDVPDLPFADNPDPEQCGIPVSWGTDEIVQVTGYYEGELVQPTVYLYDSHYRYEITGSVPSGSEVRILLYQQNPTLDYYFVETVNSNPPQEGWVPAPFLSFEPVIEPTINPQLNVFPVMPEGALEAALTGVYAGLTVVVDGSFSDVDQIKFENSMRAFEDATGITVEYMGDANFADAISERLAVGNVPDIADFRDPRLLADLVRQGYIVDPTTFITENWLQQQYNQSWLDMGIIDGQSAGVWHRFNTKSLVWYPKDDFEAAGYRIPTTWDEMITLMDRIVAEGDTPWCVGIESGSATGWVATDWLEDIMLRTTSLENYDQWTTGKLPFSSPEVKHAAETLAGIWFKDDYIYAGTARILVIYFGDSPDPMFADPPQCWLHRQGNFITGYFPQEAVADVDYAFFYLPPIEEAYGKPFLVTGDIMAMFNDRPEVRALMEYFTIPQSVSGWLENGGALAAQQTATPDMYHLDLERGIAEFVAEATSFRYDGSQLMPAVVEKSFERGMTNWVSGAVDLDAVLVEIDATWPR